MGWSLRSLSNSGAAPQQIESILKANYADGNNGRIMSFQNQIGRSNQLTLTCKDIWIIFYNSTISLWIRSIHRLWKCWKGSWKQMSSSLPLNLINGYAAWKKRGYPERRTLLQRLVKEGQHPTTSRCRCDVRRTRRIEKSNAMYIHRNGKKDYWRIKKNIQ